MAYVRWLLLLGLVPWILGINERRHDPVWLLLNPPLLEQTDADSPRCFVFKSWKTNTGPVTLGAGPILLDSTQVMHMGELVKPGADGAWRSLDAFDIRKDQVVRVCLCGEVFVLTMVFDARTITEICHEQVS